MEGGKRRREVYKNHVSHLAFYFSLFLCVPLSIFAVRLNCMFHHSSSRCGAETEQCNLSFCTASNMCTAEGEVMHNILPCLVMGFLSV